MRMRVESVSSQFRASYERRRASFEQVASSSEQVFNQYRIVFAQVPSSCVADGFSLGAAPTQCRVDAIDCLATLSMCTSMSDGGVDRGKVLTKASRQTGKQAGAAACRLVRRQSPAILLHKGQRVRRPSPGLLLHYT